MSIMKESHCLPTLEHLVTQQLIDKYSEVSGDYNPIHIDQRFAKETHFGGTIAHGMLVAAFISEMMTMAYGMDWVRSGKLKLRFKSPVRPGEQVFTHGVVARIRTLTTTSKEISCVVGVRHGENGEPAITGDAIVVQAS